MWVMLGQPICTVSVPLWAASGEAPEALGGEEQPELNELALNIARYLYPDQRGHMRQYLNIIRFLEYGDQSIQAQLSKIESNLFMSVFNRLKQWDNKKPDQKEIAAFQNNTAVFVTRSLTRAVMNLMPDK